MIENCGDNPTTPQDHEKRGNYKTSSKEAKEKKSKRSNGLGEITGVENEEYNIFKNAECAS